MYDFSGFIFLLIMAPLLIVAFLNLVFWLLKPWLKEKNK